METAYLIDTNAVSDYLVARLPASGLLFMDTIIDNLPRLSVMSRIELVGYNAPVAKIFREFVNTAHIYNLTEDIILQTIALRKSRRIKPNRRTVPNAIIAATALVHDLTLVTHNQIDFVGIPGLKLIDAHRL